MILDVAYPRALLQACPVYKPSPLRVVNFRERRLIIKDETARMNLGAFKALGGVYAVAKLIERKVGRALSATEFLTPEVKSIAANMTFVCASAGNHGLAVAAGANLFGAKSRIHLSKTVPNGFVARLKQQGAEVVRSGDDYEASVSAAISDSKCSDATHLADGSWPGYTEPPRLVMEGYTVLADEIREVFSGVSELAGMWPSHVYLQAGVGGLAAAVAHQIRVSWLMQPKIVVVEPDAAPCLRDSVLAGEILTVPGPVSNMGRLDCKTPSLLAFDILKDCADEWICISDEQAEDAVKLSSEIGFSTTPSGAAGLAACLQDEADLPLIILSECGV